MNANAGSSEWKDPDDAPDLDAEFFATAWRMVAGREVDQASFDAAKRKRMGRPPADVRRPTMTMRIDPDVLEALKATGKGWQTRVNAILRREVLGEA